MLETIEYRNQKYFIGLSYLSATRSGRSVYEFYLNIIEVKQVTENSASKLGTSASKLRLQQTQSKNPEPNWRLPDNQAAQDGFQVGELRPV